MVTIGPRIHLLTSAMDHLNQFSLKPFPASRQLQLDHSRLMLSGSRRWRLVKGDELVAQLPVGKHSLVITQYDYFDYVSTWFHLVDKTGRIVDIMSTPDYVGYIENIRADGPCAIRFGFLSEDDQWKLTVTEQGFRSLAWTAITPRLNRFMFRKRLMTLEKTSS